MWTNLTLFHTLTKMDFPEDKEMSEEASFLFLNQKYDFSRIITAANTSPTVQVDVKELNIEKKSVTELNHCSEEDFENKPITLFRFEGKYHIVFGYSRCIEASQNGSMIKARLITKHALKKCLFDENPEKTQKLIEQQLRPDHDSSEGYGRRGSYGSNNSRPQSFGRKDRGEFGQRNNDYGGRKSSSNGRNRDSY